MMNCSCNKCKHKWISRKEKPLCCPKCKRYDQAMKEAYEEMLKEKGEKQ